SSATKLFQVMRLRPHLAPLLGQGGHPIGEGLLLCHGDLQHLLGFVKLLRRRRSSGERVLLPSPTCPLGSPLRTCHFGPTLESLPHLCAVRRRGEQMPPGSEVLSNGAVC